MLLKNGANLTGSMNIPNTGAGQTYATVIKTGVTLPAGRHVLKLAVDNAGGGIAPWNFNYFGATLTAACVAESDAAFCARRGKNCGAVAGDDNCGASRTVASCGTCTAPTTCGAAVANVCGE